MTAAYKTARRTIEAAVPIVIKPASNFETMAPFTPDAIEVCVGAIREHLRLDRYHDARATLDHYIEQLAEERGIRMPDDRLKPEADLAESRLPVRITNVLAAAKLSTIGDVWAAGADRLRSLKGLGEGACGAIAREVERAGLQWDEQGRPVKAG